LRAAFRDLPLEGLEAYGRIPTFPNFRVYGYRNAANKTLQTAPDPGKLGIFSVYDYIENASINRYH